jgi:serine/threonine protein kinase
MDIICTRPNCENPQNAFFELDDNSILKTVQQKYCSTCGMPLILDGRYLPIQLLGKGGFGAAYLACDRRTPALSHCVVKQFQPQSGLSTEQFQIAQTLFDREAEVLDRLGSQHNQIPRLLASFPLRVTDSQSDKVNQFFYLVQEYIPGKTLEQLRQEKGKFSEAEILEMLRSLLGVLQYIHENGAIHRDLKPSNIMRHENGAYYLLDFGTVKQVAQGMGNTSSSTSVFTAGFAPPEQIAGQSIYPSTDLYALGATAIALLTGKSNLLELFDSYSNRWQWREQSSPVSDSTAAVLSRMLEGTPSKRFQSAAEVLQALQVSSKPTPQGIDPANLSPTIISTGQGSSNAPISPSRDAAATPPIIISGTQSGPQNVSQSGPRINYPSSPPSPNPSAPASGIPSNPPYSQSGTSPSLSQRPAPEPTQIYFDPQSVAPTPVPVSQKQWIKPAIALGTVLLLGGGLWALLRGCSGTPAGSEADSVDRKHHKLAGKQISRLGGKSLSTP